MEKMRTMEKNNIFLTYMKNISSSFVNIIKEKQSGTSITNSLLFRNVPAGEVDRILNGLKNIFC